MTHIWTRTFKNTLFLKKKKEEEKSRWSRPHGGLSDKNNTGEWLWHRGPQTLKLHLSRRRRLRKWRKSGSHFTSSGESRKKRRRSRSGAGRANKSAVEGSLRLNNPIKKSQTQQHTWAGPPGCQRQLKSIAAIRGISTKHTFSNECEKSTQALNHTQVCSLAHLLDLHTPSSVACIVFKDFWKQINQSVC